MIGFTITFDTDNDCFTSKPEKETARILRDIAGKVEAGQTFGKVMDINGNSIGTWECID